jgi:hypothetical protein
LREPLPFEERPLREAVVLCCVWLLAALVPWLPEFALWRLRLALDRLALVRRLALLRPLALLRRPEVL